MTDLERNELLKTAARILEFAPDYNKYMCNALGMANNNLNIIPFADFERDFDDNIMWEKHIPEFTKGNFHTFIKANYPELCPKLYNTRAVWIDTTGPKAEKERVTQAKQAFLLSLLK